MYEQFKNQIVTALSSTFNVEDIEQIMKSMDIVAYDYDINKKETSVAVYNSELPEIAKTFLVSKKIEGLSDTTLYNYGLVLKRFFLTLQKSPEQITANDVRVYLYNYQQQHSISNRSLDKLRQNLSSFFQWATAEQYLDRNPMITIKKIKYESKQMSYFSQVEMEHIRDACSTIREKAIVEFLYSTGCRISELSEVKISDIDWSRKTVVLFGKGSKYRTSYLNAKAEVTLRKYLDARTDDCPYLFVTERKPYGKMHKSGLEKIIHQLSDKTFENINKHFTAHTFRHTTATTAINNGMAVQDVSKLLGHANVATTMIYAHVASENVQVGHTKYVI